MAPWITFFDATPHIQTPRILYLLIVILVTSAIFIAFFYFLYHLYTTYTSVKQKSTLYQHILNAGTELVCWWPYGAHTIECTIGVTQLLNLNRNQPVRIRDLINQFCVKDAHKIHQMLQRLEQNDDAFSVEGCLIDDKTIVRMQGAKHTEEGQTFIRLTLCDETYRHEFFRTQNDQIQALAQENELLKQMLHAVPVAIWARTQHGEISFANTFYQTLCQSVPSDSSKIPELLPRHNPMSPYQFAQKARQEKRSQKQRIPLVVHGHRRFLEVSEIPYLDRTIGFAQDTTDYEELTNHLNRHLTVQQQILDNISTPIAIYTADTRLQFFNRAYSQLFALEEKWLYQGPTLPEILQKLKEIRKLPEVSNFSTIKKEQLALFNTLLHPIHDLVHQPDGKVLHQTIAPHPLGGLIFIFEDVSDKLSLERNYNTLVAVQRETLDNLFEGVIVLGSDNLLRLFNPAVTRIWKLTATQLQENHHAKEIFHLIRHRFESFSAWDQYRRDMLLLFNQRQPMTNRLILADQSMLQYTYVPLPDGSHLIIFVDISERWRFEQALQKRHEILEQADDMKSHFISHVSYELKIPLRTMIDWSETLMNQHNGALNEQQISYCRKIHQSSQRLLLVIGDFLDCISIASVQSSLNMKRIDLEAFLSSLVTLVHHRSYDQEVTVSYQNHTAIQFFYADEWRLKQTILHLLVYTMRLTSAGGGIILTASATTEPEPNQRLILSISRTDARVAQGMASQHPEGTIDSQMSTINSEGDWELALVRDLIALHGGDMRLESHPDKGTVVVCNIPLRMKASEL